MLNDLVRRGVVLAAGVGSRMRPLTRGRPKALLPFQGKPLVLYPVEALASSGIEEIAVVVGHKGEAIREALGDGRRLGVRLKYVHNPYYRGENALSVLMAHGWLEGEPFLLCMGDHVIEPGLVSRLLEMPTIRETLCVDRVPRYCTDIDEATKVRLDPFGFITRIGKAITPWDAVDTGVFLLTQRFIDTARELIAQTGMNLEISEVVESIAGSQTGFATCDVTGLLWADMDTWEDLYTVGLGGEDWSVDTMASSRDT